MLRATALFSSASILVLITPHLALSQTTAAVEPSAAVEEVVVTGSRLQSGFAAPTPVKVVGQEMIQQRAPAGAGELVAEIPGFRPVGPGIATRSGTNAVGGQNQPDLRGLGPTRTLVLIDGRRVVGTNATQTVDINTIPTNLIGRVEVVTGGASAAYGSDAVAGVVNFILLDRLNGIRGSATKGISERNDNRETEFSIAAGHTFFDDKLHVVLGGDYNKNRGVPYMYNRKWGAAEPGQLANPVTRPAGVPAVEYRNGVEFATLTPGSIIQSGPLKGTAFDPNGNPYQFQYGTVVGTQMYGSTANYGNNQFMAFNIKNPIERTGFMGRATYDLNDDTSLFIEGGFGMMDNAGTKSNITQQLALTVSRDNPFLPAATRAAMSANNLTTVTIGRVNNDIGPYDIFNHTETWRVATGAKGKIFGDWNWDLYYQHGQTTNDFNVNEQHVPNFLASTNVVTGANGQPACGPIATNPNLSAAQRVVVQPNCVPYNIFGDGRASKEAIDYVRQHMYSVTTVKQDVAAATISGEPFESWAGPVSMAAGLEYRKDSMAQVGDPVSAVGSPFIFGNPQTFSGANSVKEGFVEIGVPLARDMPLIKSLDINGAIRRTDYKISGPVTTWKVGLSYEPFDMIRIRATESRDIRAPNLSDLFSLGGASTGGIGSRNPFNNQQGQFRTVTRGNPNLAPENADTFTAGLVFQPTWRWASGFRASIDYYNIIIKDVIASVSQQETVNRCYAGQTIYCPQITFDNSVFGIAEVRTFVYNLNKLATNGVDIDVNYRIPLGSLPGRLDLRGLYSIVGELTTSDVSGQTDRSGASVGGLPSRSGNFTATYTNGRYTGSLQARYTGSMKVDATLQGPDDPRYNPALSTSTSQNRFPSIVYYNLQSQVDVYQRDSRRLQLFGVINNLLDTQPPLYAPVAMNVTGGTNPYDLVGRSFKFGLRFEF